MDSPALPPLCSFYMTFVALPHHCFILCCSPNQKRFTAIWFYNMRSSFYNLTCVYTAPRAAPLLYVILLCRGNIQTPLVPAWGGAIRCRCMFNDMVSIEDPPPQPPLCWFVWPSSPHPNIIKCDSAPPPPPTTISFEVSSHTRVSPAQSGLLRPPAENTCFVICCSPRPTTKSLGVSSQNAWPCTS